MADQDNQSDSNVHRCPECGAEMAALLFMGELLEGYTCPVCRVMYPVDDDGDVSDKPLARVI